MSTENFFDDGDLSRPVSEIPADIYDDGKKVITRQITPRTTPPMRFGMKKKVLKIFELRSFAVTNRARPNATTLITTIETITNAPVN